MPYITGSDETELFVTDTGSGQPLILIHGGFMSHRVWDYQIERLSDEYRVIALDLCGHGASAKPYLDYTPKRFAQDIADLLETLELDQGILVGWSLGATVAATYLTEYKNPIEGTVFLSSGIFEGIAHSGSQSTEGLDFDSLIQAHRSNRPDAMMAFVSGFFAEAPSQTMQHWLWSIGMECPMYVGIDVLELYRDMDHSRLEKRLSNIDIPTAVFHGAHDTAASLTDAEFVAAEVLPNATFVPFPESGHVPFLEQRELFNEELVSYIKSVYSSPL
ncbi:alpha/beta fold hydrolase [Haladaptatus sp. R4]|uniref:alpha/beta fold hydrolase n=1 Tax=Haladaptatus sp. R4 TaxID=1679489 RepID=UPI0009EE75E2|nr:alpha/beta hydrolase [Haladaptatus sp. R4]